MPLAAVTMAAASLERQGRRRHKLGAPTVGVVREGSGWGTWLHVRAGAKPLRGSPTGSEAGRLGTCKLCNSSISASICLKKASRLLCGLRVIISEAISASAVLPASRAQRRASQ